MLGRRLDRGARASMYQPMVKFQFELDPREAEEFVRPLPARQQLVYRIAIRGICARCRGDRTFRTRTEALIDKFKTELPAILAEAAKLGDELKAAAKAW
jgi:hypothetical protein